MRRALTVMKKDMKRKKNMKNSSDKGDVFPATEENVNAMLRIKDSANLPTKFMDSMQELGEKNAKNTL